MKKILCAALVCILLFSSACAAPDFTDWTWDELVALQHYITLTLMQRPEWKEVTVPAGHWVVGVDIPEGEYSIRCAGGSAYIGVTDAKGYLVINNALSGDEKIGKVKLKENYTIELTGAVIFAPAVILGF